MSRYVKYIAVITIPGAQCMVYTDIYGKIKPNVGKYTIQRVFGNHVSCSLCSWFVWMNCDVAWFHQFLICLLIPQMGGQNVWQMSCKQFVVPMFVTPFLGGFSCQAGLAVFPRFCWMVFEGNQRWDFCVTVGRLHFWKNPLWNQNHSRLFFMFFQHVFNDQGKFQGPPQ